MFVSEKILEYLIQHSAAMPAVLDELERETYLSSLHAHMISGKTQGALLRFLVKLSKATQLLEIGTFTGYASICLADGLPENGILHTIEIDEEKEEIIQKYIHKAGLSKKVKLHIADAKEILASLLVGTHFDFVFIDAAKGDNWWYLNFLADSLPSGALVVVDNVLWKSKVLDDTKDNKTKTIHDFNQKVASDKRFEVLMLPIRDGLSCILIK